MTVPVSKQYVGGLTYVDEPSERSGNRPSEAWPDPQTRRELEACRPGKKISIMSQELTMPSKDLFRSLSPKPGMECTELDPSIAAIRPRLSEVYDRMLDAYARVNRLAFDILTTASTEDRAITKARYEANYGPDDGTGLMELTWTNETVSFYTTKLTRWYTRAKKEHAPSSAPRDMMSLTHYDDRYRAYRGHPERLDMDAKNDREWSAISKYWESAYWNEPKPGQ